MEVEIQITVDIIEIQEMLQKAIENKHHQHLIRMYEKMIEVQQ